MDASNATDATSVSGIPFPSTHDLPADADVAYNAEYLAKPLDDWHRRWLVEHAQEMLDSPSQILRDEAASILRYEATVKALESRIQA